MSDEFDPYHRWLGIPPKHQPPDHYRLLGVEQFESDTEVIDDAAERQISHVRRKGLSQHSQLSQQILNELAAAKACLLDPTRKASYDETLQSRLKEDKGTSRAEPIPAQRPAPFANVEHRSAPLADNVVTTKRATDSPDAPTALPQTHSSRAPLPDAGIVVECSCGWQFVAPPHLAGSARACETCGQLMQIPAADSGNDPFATLLPSYKLRMPTVRGALRRADQFLLHLVGTENTILHQFLRIALPFALITLIIVPGSFVIQLASDGSSPSHADDDSHVVQKTLNVPVLPGNTDTKSEAPGRSVLIRLTPQIIDEEVTFQIGLNGQQEPVFFKLVSPPDGASIDSATGLLTWTPTETQGPGTYSITAIAQPSELSGEPLDTITFQVEVREVNKPPVLAQLSDQSCTIGNQFGFSLAATDPDIPRNKVQFRMVGHVDAILNSETGSFSWNPRDENAGQNYRMTFVATDDGAPPRESQQSILFSVARKAGDITGKFRQDRFTNTIQIRFKGSDIEVYGGLGGRTNPDGIYKKTAPDTYTYTNDNRRLSITAVSNDILTWRDSTGSYTFRRISN